MEILMAVKCVTCGLLFRNDNELDWHVRQEHMQASPPARDERLRRRRRQRTRDDRKTAALRDRTNLSSR